MKKTVVALSMLTLLASCLKDKNIEDQVYGMDGTDRGTLVEIPHAPFEIYNLTASPRDTTFNIVTVRLDANDPAPEDIQVTLAPDPSLIGEYNTNNSTAFINMDPSDYSVSGLVVTIPRGQREGHMTMTVNTTNILDGAYALGYKIASVSNSKYKISRNYAGIVAAVGVKNKYDGNYQSKGAAFHPSYGNYVWNTVGVFACGNGFSLVTSGPSSVILAPGQPLYVGGITYFSAVLPQFTVNEATNKVTIATTNSTVFDAYPDYDSRYDPGTKTFYVKYGWSGTRVATDTFTYCGAR